MFISVIENTRALIFNQLMINLIELKKFRKKLSNLNSLFIQKCDLLGPIDLQF